MNDRKLILITFMIVSTMCQSLGAADDWSRSSRENEKDQVSIWRNKLDDLSMSSETETYEQLSLGLINMAHRRQMEGHSEEVDKVFSDIQSRLLRFSGHAQYYAEEIKRGQESVEGIPGISGPRGDYNRLRERNFQILALLPSPETIHVLGEFLADDKDLLGVGRGGSVMANSSLAIQALDKIGLRACPQQRPFTDLPNDIIVWRDWYERVRAGTLVFSFEGQNVEYRFNPDGTWETSALANAPHDARQLPNSSDTLKEREVKRPPQSGIAEDLRPQGSLSPWIIRAAVALLAAALWMGVRSSSRPG